jgi:hypothetical protein
MVTIRLPSDDGRFEEFVMSRPATWRTATLGQPLARLALSAAHVVSDPRADISPMADVAIDFVATQRFREYLWDLGLPRRWIPRSAARVSTGSRLKF